MDSSYFIYHPYAGVYRKPLAKPFPHGVPLGTTGVSTRPATARLLDLESDFPNKFARRAEINRLKSKRRLEALDFGLLPYNSWSTYLRPTTPRRYIPDDITYRYSYLYPTVISRYPVRPIRMVQVAPLSSRCIPMPDQNLDELTLEIEADEARIQAQHEAKRIQSAMWQSEATDRAIKLCKERNRIRNELRRIDNARMLAPIYSSPGTSTLGTRHKVLINYHKGALGQQEAGRKTPDEHVHAAHTESGSTFPEESVKRTHKQDTDVFVNGTTEPAVDEASVIQYSSFRYMSKTVTKEIQSTFSVDQQQPLPPPPSESAVEPQAEQKASNEQDEVEIQQVSKPKKERKYDIHKEKKRKEEKKAVTDAAPEKLKPQLHKIKTEKVSEPELHRIKTEEAPEPLLAEKEQPIEFLETPILEPVKETVVESPAEKQTISEPPAEEQKIIEPPIVDEPVAKVTESLFKEEAPTIGLSARITEPLDVDALVTESKEVEETTSTEAISEPEPSKEENVNVEFRLHSPKRHRDVPTSEPDTLPSEDANAVVEESIKTVDEQASDTIISPPLAKSQLSTEEISEQTTLSEQHVEYEFSQTKKTKSTTQSSTNESERQFQHEKPSSELESIQSHTHDDLPLSEIPAETAPSVTKDTDHQANDEVPSPGVKRLQSIASYHEGDACDPSEWDDNESVDVESPLKEPVKKIILSASDDAIPSLKADESGEEKESATVTITTTKDRAGIEGMETVMMMDKGDGVDPINLSMERVSSVAGGDDILDISASTNENHAEAGSAISGGNDDETLSANGRPLSVDAESLAADDEHILDEALQTTYGMHDLNVEPTVQEPDEETVKYDDDNMDGYRFQSVVIDEND